MKRSGASQGPPASELISKRIAEGEEVDEAAIKALVRQAVAPNSSGKSKTSEEGEVLKDAGSQDDRALHLIGPASERSC